jgi:hypothetical protein
MPTSVESKTSTGIVSNQPSFKPDTTIKILGIIHFLVFYLKHNIPETAFCPHLQMEGTQVDPIHRANLSIQTPATSPTGFIKPA